MAEQQQPVRLSYAEQNKERVGQMLEQRPGAVRAVIAETVETKQLANQLRSIETIFKNARMSIGFNMSYEEFQELFSLYENVQTSITAVIDKATEFGVYRNRRSEFKTLKPEIIRLLAEGKEAGEIATALNIEPNKMNTWVGLIKKEQTEAA